MEAVGENDRAEVQSLEIFGVVRRRQSRRFKGDIEGVNLLTSSSLPKEIKV
jgi:hypothetical protein